jgi:hypothetical protein
VLDPQKHYTTAQSSGTPTEDLSTSKNDLAGVVNDFLNTTTAKPPGKGKSNLAATEKRKTQSDTTALPTKTTKQPGTTENTLVKTLSGTRTATEDLATNETAERRTGTIVVETKEHDCRHSTLFVPTTGETAQYSDCPVEVDTVDTEEHSPFRKRLKLDVQTLGAHGHQQPLKRSEDREVWCSETGCETYNPLMSDVPVGAHCKVRKDYKWVSTHHEHCIKVCKSNIRSVLQVIRQKSVSPELILENGLSVSDVAHQYIIYRHTLRYSKIKRV